MGSLGTSMHLITLFTLCIALVFMTHMYIFAIVHAEQGRVEPAEPAPVEGADCE
jgi:hypothetical protein